MSDRLSAKDAEITKLRDELAKSEDWIRILEKTHKTNNRLSEERRSAAARQDAETIASLRAELAEVRADVKQESSLYVAARNATARRDAETIARLREALQRIEHESVDDVSRADARAALAHLPQEEPSA